MPLSAETLTVKLPDGTPLELHTGATGADAALAIGEGLHRAALAIKVDDEFACTASTYDYRDFLTQTVEGLPTGTCTGTSLRTGATGRDVGWSILWINQRTNPPKGI